MNNIKILIFALVLVLAGGSPTPAQASQQEGYITQIITRDGDGLIYLYLSGERTSRPPCAQGSTYWMINDETSETGKRQFALLLAAQLTRTKVRIVGYGSCDRWENGESIDRAVIITPVSTSS